MNDVLDEIRACDDEQKQAVVLAAFLVEVQQALLLLILVHSQNKLGQDENDERCGGSSFMSTTS